MEEAAPTDVRKRDTAHSLHSISLCYSNNGLNMKALCKTFLIFLHGPQHAPFKQDPYTRQLVQFTFSQSFNDPEMRLETVVSRRCQVFGFPLCRHSNTQLPQRLATASDWRWRWPRLWRKDALGRWVSRRWAVSTPRPPATCGSLARFGHLELCAGMLGQLGRDPDD